MSSDLRIQNTSQWFQARYDTTSKELRLSNGSPIAVTNTAFRDQGTGLGWFLLAAPDDVLPAIHIRSISGTSDEYLVNLDKSIPVRLARTHLEKSLLYSLGRLIPHDLNGKIMGVNGIINSWEQDFPDPDTAMEDLYIIRDSFHSLIHEASLLGWLFKSDGEFERVFELNEIHSTMSNYVKRFFRPPNSFTFELESPESSVCSTPHYIALWIGSVCKILSLIQEAKEPVSLTLGDTEETGQSQLKMTIQCASFSDFVINMEHVDFGKLDPVIIDWLVLFFHLGGQWGPAPDKTELPDILLKIPMSQPTPHLKSATILPGNADVSPTSCEEGKFHISDRNDTCEILRAIAPHALSLESIRIDPVSMKYHQPTLDAAIDCFNKDASLKIHTIT